MVQTKKKAHCLGTKQRAQNRNKKARNGAGLSGTGNGAGTYLAAFSAARFASQA